MASGINKSRQPGTCNGSKAPRCSSAEGFSKEIHMQMCKKIAQLTKVIYALNTKNDEHEDSIQALREAHEEEVQHILAEMRETVLQYKSKVEEEQLLRKHIQALETAVEQHRRLKEEALAELTLCKKQVEEREPRAQMKQTLSTDTVDTNADSANRLLHLDQKADELLNECKLSRRENLDKKDNSAEKFSVKGQVLVNEKGNLKSENQGATKEYTQKTNQLQASCEALKKPKQRSMTETRSHHLQREMEQRNCSEAEGGFWLQQVKKLEADLEEKSQKINEKKKHSQKLKERIQVVQLKQILDQQADNFKESLKKHNLQSSKEKEKLLQDLQNSIKENENAKLQLEASHQKVLKMLEKNKKQELKEGSSQNQIRSLHDELEKCQSEISKLKKENFLLKDTMELLSTELETQKQEAAQLQDKERQHKRTRGSEPPQTKDDPKQDPEHQEWFTKYFSF
ncbi:hypothetical protein ASZ78_004217 [Callipepla squamata]|uniref:Protein FAM184A/B N-terminal domain-containing protein n=1 Tax=Callipepla squamata TaxID=9009 RepID=A0A226MVS4_CALSU|nr:hypothetical protein ASZ78_004217 [Callipepla squamata]